MDLLEKYLKLPEKDKKAPPHEKAHIVNTLRDFMGDTQFLKMGNGDIKKAYPFWLRKVGRCKYGGILDIIKSLESLPLKYNKAGAIVNRLKQYNITRINGTRTQATSK